METLKPLTSETVNLFTEQEQQRIIEFQSILPNVVFKPLSVEIDVSQPQPHEQAQKDFLVTDYQREPTFYTVPEAAEDLARIVGFEPFVSSTQKASGHGVFFGSLYLEDGSSLHVAVKPHFVNEDDISSKRQAERSCLNDYFTNVSAAACGFESLKPVGFILSEDGEPYSLTVLDETITTFDSVDWRNFFEPGFENSGMKEMWYKAALQTAYLHNKGDSWHGDLAARNISQNIFGQVNLIDWERGNITEAPSSDIEERFGKSWIDIRSLMASMIRPTYVKNPGIGMFENCDENYWDAFKDVFLDDYMLFRRELASQGSHHMKRLKEVEAELEQLEGSLREEMFAYQSIALAKAQA